MESLSKNTASLVSSRNVVSSRILMIKATGDAPLFTNMKMIKDLGFSYTNENSKQTRHFAIYECSFCGKHFRAATGEMNRGRVHSCGCQYLCPSTTHGLSKTHLFQVWKGMKNRCYNKKEVAYPNYGGRGIVICDEWKHDFVAFYNWANIHGYQHGLIIDREDNDKGYSPENCRWVNEVISTQNQRVLKSSNTSGYRGVAFKDNKWRCRIQHQKRSYFLGNFDTPEQAVQAYNDFVIARGTAHPLNIIK